jgi:hypothetical protein
MATPNSNIATDTTLELLVTRSVSKKNKPNQSQIEQESRKIQEAIA